MIAAQPSARARDQRGARDQPVTNRPLLLHHHLEKGTRWRISCCGGRSLESSADCACVSKDLPPTSAASPYKGQPIRVFNETPWIAPPPCWPHDQRLLQLPMRKHQRCTTRQRVVDHARHVPQDVCYGAVWRDALQDCLDRACDVSRKDISRCCLGPTLVQLPSQLFRRSAPSARTIMPADGSRSSGATNDGASSAGPPCGAAGGGGNGGGGRSASDPSRVESESESSAAPP